MTNCENCRWYESLKTSLGYCRKNPPTPLSWPDGKSSSWWPEVDSEEWCGQWEEIIDDVTPSQNILEAWQKLCNHSLPGRKASGR